MSSPLVSNAEGQPESTAGEGASGEPLGEDSPNQEVRPHGDCAARSPRLSRRRPAAGLSRALPGGARQAPGLPGQCRHQPEAGVGAEGSRPLLPHQQCQRASGRARPLPAGDHPLRGGPREGGELSRLRLLARDRLPAGSHRGHQSGGPFLRGPPPRGGRRGPGLRPGASFGHRALAIALQGEEGPPAGHPHGRARRARSGRLRGPSDGSDPPRRRGARLERLGHGQSCQAHGGDGSRQGHSGAGGRRSGGSPSCDRRAGSRLRLLRDLGSQGLRSHGHRPPSGRGPSISR